MDGKMSVEEAARRFGLNPTEVGYRNRGWFIAGEGDGKWFNGEEYPTAETGDLVVCARDGGSNVFADYSGDPETPNYKGHEVGGDFTYVYYVFSPLAEPAK